jgi:hypothetical protein
MGLASYEVREKGKSWTVLHDGESNNEYATKEAAFEAAVGAASVALRQGHDIRVTVRGGASDKVTLGVAK